MATLEAFENATWSPILQSNDASLLELIKNEMESTGLKCRITGGIV